MWIHFSFQFTVEYCIFALLSEFHGMHRDRRYYQNIESFFRRRRGSSQTRTRIPHNGTVFNYNEPHRNSSQMAIPTKHFQMVTSIYINFAVIPFGCAGRPSSVRYVRRIIFVPHTKCTVKILHHKRRWQNSIKLASNVSHGMDFSGAKQRSRCGRWKWRNDSLRDYSCSGPKWYIFRMEKAQTQPYHTRARVFHSSTLPPTVLHTSTQWRRRNKMICISPSRSTRKIDFGENQYFHRKQFDM